MLRRQTGAGEHLAALRRVRDQLRLERVHQRRRRVAMLVCRERRLLVELLQHLGGRAVRLRSVDVRQSGELHCLSRRRHLHRNHAALLLPLLMRISCKTAPGRGSFQYAAHVYLHRPHAGLWR